MKWRNLPFVVMAGVLSPGVGYPRSVQAEPSRVYSVRQDDTRGLTMVLPRPIENTMEVVRDHPALPAARQDHSGKSGRRQSRIRSDAGIAAPARMTSSRSTPLNPTGMSGQGDVLPGLPGALVAVVEGGPPGVAAGPSSGASPYTRRSTFIPVVPPSPAATSGPVSLTAAVLDDPAPALRGLFFPFETTVGAAAFSRGDDVLVVFDAARPFDLSTVQDDPVGARSSILLLPEATILRLKMHHAAGLVLRRLPTGWLIQTNGTGEPVRAISPTMDGAVLRFPVGSAGRTVVVPDPQTGGNLLVGTIRSGHDAVEVRRRGSNEIIEQTIQGIVVDPLSDRLELRPTIGAFLLAGMGVEATDIGSVPPGLKPGSGIPAPRIMSLAAGSPEVLYRRFKEARAAAAAAPAGARFAPRLLAAQDALALGDGAEAATIMRVAMADDAREVAALRPRLVATAAALLEGHSDEVDLLDDPRASTDGERGLWRAVKLARQNPASPEAARLFEASLPLLQSYPAPLQAVLVPLAGASLARGGNDAQAALIEHLPYEHALAFARALLAERRGQRQAALTALDRLSLDPEVSLAEVAVEEAVAIRQRSSGADPRELADILEGHLLDARIAGREIASRFRVAELRAQAGQWQKALDLLRETVALYPEQQIEAHRRAGQVLMRLAAAPLKTGDGEALAQASVIEASAGMLPEGADGSRISLFLAARLAALELPERAAPIVREMMHAAMPGTDKAELGLRLAVLDFQQNDLAGARAALQDSDPGGLPAGLATERLIMMARSLAGDGQLDQALATISAVNTTAGLDLRASLLARRGDWAGTSDTLLALARQGQPASGKLDAAGQDLFLRLASAASRSRDKTRIGQIMSLGSGRFTDPGKDALFRLLVSDTVADAVDPVKVSSEVAILHQTPAVFDSIAK